MKKSYEIYNENNEDTYTTFDIRGINIIKASKILEMAYRIFSNKLEEIIDFQEMINFCQQNWTKYGNKRKKKT